MTNTITKKELFDSLTSNPFYMVSSDKNSFKIIKLDATIDVGEFVNQMYKEGYVVDVSPPSMFRFWNPKVLYETETIDRLTKLGRIRKIVK